uniref:Putative secreted protein n=1 Tax=Anopheles marajoara TaxID=58244 RepID=A0A2M4CAT0_9DIPT
MYGWGGRRRIRRLTVFWLSTRVNARARFLRIISTFSINDPLIGRPTCVREELLFSLNDKRVVSLRVPEKKGRSSVRQSSSSYAT